MKKRLDVILAEKGLLESREKAKAVIMSGIVYVDNQKADKPGMPVNQNANIEIRGNTLKYVSRGGLKLEKALSSFCLDLQEKVCMDVGASTGGFTDCMLQNGAAKVYCIDVGYGQLAWKLRTDLRVVNLERRNIRYVTSEDVPEFIDFATIDVSFISLRLVLPVVYSLLKENGEIVALIKPQFEAGKDKVGKKGVVREPKTHLLVVENIISFAISAGFFICGFDFSPVRGPEGNIEYLLHLRKSKSGVSDTINPRFVVEQSHEVLKGEKHL